MDDFQFEILRFAWRDLALGAWVTIKISGLSFILALAIGFTVGTARAVSPRWQRLTAPYVEFFRGTPLLIQLFFLYYGLPSVGINMSSYVAACLGLSLNGGAYISEIVRGSLAGVDQGQLEAALATGLSPFQALRHIVLPQALFTAVPPLVNSFSSQLKESSLISVLAITELTRIGQLIYTRTFRPFEIYLAVALMYFVMSYSVSRLSKKLELRLGACRVR